MNTKSSLILDHISFNLTYNIILTPISLSYISILLGSTSLSMTFKAKEVLTRSWRRFVNVTGTSTSSVVLDASVVAKSILAQPRYLSKG